MPLKAVLPRPARRFRAGQDGWRRSATAPASGGDRPRSSGAPCGSRRRSWSSSISASSMPAISAKSASGSAIDRAGQDGVMGAAGDQPGLDRRPQVRPRPPDRAGDREAGQGLLGADDVDDVRDDPEAVAQIGHARHEGRPGRRVEDEPDRVGPRADRQRVDLAARPAAPRSSGRPRACAPRGRSGRPGSRW